MTRVFHKQAPSATEIWQSLPPLQVTYFFRRNRDDTRSTEEISKRKEETRGTPLDLVPHRCCDACRAALCRAHNAAADFRSLRDVARVSRCTPQKTLSHLSCQSPITMRVLHLPRCRGSISKRKRIALHGSVAASLSRVALRCATKAPIEPSPNLAVKLPMEMHQVWL